MKDARPSPPIFCSFWRLFSSRWRVSEEALQLHVSYHCTFCNKFISVQIWPQGTTTLNTKSALLLCCYISLDSVWCAAPNTLICFSIWPDMLIKTSSGHDYSAWIQASVLLNVALRAVILASARAAAETNSDSDTESEKFSVKTGSLDVSVRCISSQFLAHFHSGGPFGGICTSACLDNSAVPRVCKETLGKVRADCLKDGSNVT